MAQKQAEGLLKLKRRLESTTVWKTCGDHRTMAIVSKKENCTVCGEYCSVYNNVDFRGYIHGNITSQGFAIQQMLLWIGNTGEIGLPIHICRDCGPKMSSLQPDYILDIPQLVLPEMSHLVLQYLYTAIVTCPFCI